MIKLLIGFILGLAVATVGFGGLAALADNGVQNAKATIQKHANQPTVAVQPALSPELQAAIERELAGKR